MGFYNLVVCGGTEKTIADPDGSVWVVSAGGAGLGVSGSGDVQAGIASELPGEVPAILTEVQASGDGAGTPGSGSLPS